MPSERVHLHIADVILAVPASAGVEAGMVVVTEDDPPFRSLKIIIGQPEARAIQAAWHGAVPSRPSTWDLFISTVAILGGRLDCVVITAVQEERHYFAVLEVEQAGDRRILACRPSDALALAVRGYNADIFAESSVLEAAGLMPDGSKASAAAGADTSGPAEGHAESALAAREAALAAREAELAARERALMELEAAAPAPAKPAPAPPVPAPPADGQEARAPLTAADRTVIAAEALEVAADAVAVAAEALERPAAPHEPAPHEPAPHEPAPHEPGPDPSTVATPPGT